MVRRRHHARRRCYFHVIFSFAETDEIESYTALVAARCATPERRADAVEASPHEVTAMLARADAAVVICRLGNA